MSDRLPGRGQGRDGLSMLVVVRRERRRVGFRVSLAKQMRFLSTSFVGAWRNGGARALGVPGAYAV